MHGLKALNAMSVVLLSMGKLDDVCAMNSLRACMSLTHTFLLAEYQYPRNYSEDFTICSSSG